MQAATKSCFNAGMAANRNFAEVNIKTPGLISVTFQLFNLYVENLPHLGVVQRRIKPFESYIVHCFYDAIGDIFEK